ncbi:MAG: radical SAM protein [Thermoguttaceae bacterium]|nr:radical SAM protein [Thermoguttaceae bacterium]MDW8038957.1 4Fe-4S single cluster domain-containing protein [Thermoguttaceae bacterium]
MKSRLGLNIGAWQERSVANGPGQRFVLWMQGCRRRCRGCFNRHFWPLKPRVVVPVEWLAERILSIGGIEGVTYTGGEPILQAQALTVLSRRLKSAGLSVVCYSGYTLEELKQMQNRWVEELLGLVDILIDGPYLEEQAGVWLWRGSKNQRVHFFTERYRSWADRVNEPIGHVEIGVGKSGYRVTGIWPEEVLKRLAKAMEH